MTYREKLQKGNPDRVGVEFIGGCIGCPGDYWSGAPEFIGYCPLWDEVDFSCCDCWDLEAPKNQMPIEA